MGVVGGQCMLTGSVQCVACVPGVSGKDTTARKCIREKNSRCLRGLVERVKDQLASFGSLWAGYINHVKLG